MKRTPRKPAARPTPGTATRKPPSPPRRATTAKRQTILRLPAVCERTGLSRSQVYRVLGDMRIKLGPNSAGWIEAEIEKWITERIAASRGGVAAE